ncbi:hypothetical protein QYE76_048786 [Lolium multiflorum]|uniref:Uncharacterized protein n=1 Tax=Lolium multiflorum TaxID=4521 RepID=A0AAD8SLQ0_LOLMU|nr:hypothetical protein QYE76_048786 [Lolium multiflorum]
MAELKKENETITVYFHQMKALSDSLTSIGMPLRNEEFISYVLAGLGDEYGALYEVVTARTTPMPIRDLFSQLQSTEARKLSQRRTSSGAIHYPAAHATTHGGPSIAAFGAARGGSRPPAPFSSGSPKMAPSSSTSGSKPNNGRGSVVCQLCGIPRHTASKYFKRFNRDFLGLGNDGSNTERQFAMAMTAAQGTHGAPQQSADPAWYADSGATHHITHELDKLTSREPYDDTDQDAGPLGTPLSWDIGSSLSLEQSCIRSHVSLPSSDLRGKPELKKIQLWVPCTLMVAPEITPTMQRFTNSKAGPALQEYVLLSGPRLLVQTMAKYVSVEQVAQEVFAPQYNCRLKQSFDYSARSAAPAIAHSGLACLGPDIADSSYSGARLPRTRYYGPDIFGCSLVLFIDYF